MARSIDGRNELACLTNACDGHACLQVREDIPVEPVRRADGGVGGRGAEPVHPAERGAAVRVQLPAQHRRHPGQVVHAGAGGRRAPGDARHLAQLPQLRPPPRRAAPGGGAPHAAGAPLLAARRRRRLLLRAAPSQEGTTRRRPFCSDARFVCRLHSMLAS